MATKRKWTEAAALAGGVEDSGAYRPCQHLAEYRSKHGTRGFRALQKCLRTGPPGRASLRREDEEVHRCAVCGKSHGRLYACLVCAAVGCLSSAQVGGHARSHAQGFPGHDLAIDLDRAELFCCICNDQVYDPDFDRVVLCAQTASVSNQANILNGSNNNGPLRSKVLNVYTRQGKRHKDAVYKPWVPTAKDQLVLKQCATPLKEDSRLPCGLRGLNNMGNTCFMNSVLQALLHTPPLRNYFLSDRHNKAICQKKASHLCLGCDMDDIFSAAFSGDRTPYSPAQFLYSWWQHAANLAGYAQQDAHEFFISTVEGIHANSEASAQQPERHKVNYAECRCIVHRVFSGLLRSDVTCTACGFTSTTYDPCVDISLDLDSAAMEKQQNSNGYVYASSSTLLGCLDRFTRPEKLGVNERFFCESCQSRQEAIKQMSIRKLPLVLCFHIKRFEHSARNYRKVDRYVQFPCTLDMASYLSSSIVRLRHGNRLIFVDGTTTMSSSGEYGGDSNASNYSSNSNGGGGGSSSNGNASPSSEFELFAVVTHSGKLEGGHYVSYLRLGGQWYKCDDAWITRVSEGVVRAAQAYMLYYVQKTLSYKASGVASDDPKTIMVQHHQKADENNIKLGYNALVASGVLA